MIAFKFPNDISLFLHFYVCVTKYTWNYTIIIKIADIILHNKRKKLITQIS